VLLAVAQRSGLLQCRCWLVSTLLTFYILGFWLSSRYRVVLF